MTRALVVIRTDADRAKVATWAGNVQPGTRVEFRAARRSTDQNSKLWACLSDVSRQKEHFGRKYPPEVWKCLMMHGWRREVQFAPSLDGDGVVPIVFRSSELTKAEMSELLEFIISWGTQNGVLFSDGE